MDDPTQLMDDLTKLAKLCQMHANKLAQPTSRRYFIYGGDHKLNVYFTPMTKGTKPPNI